MAVMTGFTPAEECDAIAGLSERQREILGRVCGGETYEAAAEALSISPHTVKNSLTKAYGRLRLIGARSRNRSAMTAACRMLDRCSAPEPRELRAHTVRVIYRPPDAKGLPMTEPSPKTTLIVDPLMPLVERFVAAVERIAGALEAANEVNPLALLDAAMRQAETERTDAPATPPAPSPSISPGVPDGVPASEAWRFR